MRAPSVSACVTAVVIPVSLNEPVGLALVLELKTIKSAIAGRAGRVVQRGVTFCERDQLCVFGKGQEFAEAPHTAAIARLR